MKKQEIQDAWDSLKTTHRDLYDSVGIHGTVIEFTNFGDLFSRVYFRWWSTHPENWSELATFDSSWSMRHREQFTTEKRL